jgi:hypothetical protein
LMMRWRELAPVKWEGPLPLAPELRLNSKTAKKLNPKKMKKIEKPFVSRCRWKGVILYIICFEITELNSKESWGQFHQCSTGSFYARSLTPILLAHGVELRAYFVAMCISKVGRIFVGETEWHLLSPKNDYWHICALRHKVGEIYPWFAAGLYCQNRENSWEPVNLYLVAVIDKILHALLRFTLFIKSYAWIWAVF